MLRKTLAVARALGGLREGAIELSPHQEALLDLAVERGDIADVDTAAVARVIAHLGQDFIRPDVLPTLRSSPKVAADSVVDIVLRGLTRP